MSQLIEWIGRTAVIAICGLPLAWLAIGLVLGAIDTMRRRKASRAPRIERVEIDELPYYAHVKTIDLEAIRL